MRFRKSVRICKGVRINFSKSGASCTFGIPGLSMNVGKKGAFLNTGIPGTGLYDRTKIGGASSNCSRSTSYFQPQYVSRKIDLSLDDNGTITFYDENGKIITDPSMIRKIKATSAFKEERLRMMEERKNEINSETDSIINIHDMSSKVDTLSVFNDALKNLKPYRYEREEYSEEIPTKESVYKQLYLEAQQNIKSFAFWTLKSKRNEYVSERLDMQFNTLYDEWQKRKMEFDKKQHETEIELNEQYDKQYNLQKTTMEALISGDKDCVEDSISDWISTVNLPVDFDMQFEYYQELHILSLDIDLPEIEDLPQDKAAELANGTVKRKNKTQKELKADYIKCVFGLAVFFGSHLFNISPAIENIIISGYTQRRNSKTGELQNDYVYSVKFSRSEFEIKDLTKVNSYEFCMTFDNRCNVTQAMMLKTIEPFDIVD